MVSPYYLPYKSGAVEYQRNLAEGLVKRGHTVTVLTSRHTNTLHTHQTIRGVQVIRAPIIFRFERATFAPLLSMKFVVLARRHDVINIHMPIPEAGILALIAYICSKRKPVLTYHSDHTSRVGRPLYNLLNLIYYATSNNIALKISYCIVCNSYDYAQTAKTGSYMKKVLQIYPPIDTSRFRKVTKTNQIKEKLGINKKEKVIGFVGRLTREKGLQYLIEAIPQVLKDIPNIKVIIAGESKKIAGGTKESIKHQLCNLKNQLGLDCIIFSGYIKDEILPEFYSACDVTVLPSINILESFGIVQVESLLCGTPVVSTNLPGVRDVIRLTKGGLLVEPRNAKQLAEAIVQILRNNQKFQVEREKLLKVFDKEKQINKYEKIFSAYSMDTTFNSVNT
ncbi:MAG: glycosyltransferase family 4 protein [Candidatus Bathyarchaeota archaeon]|nr:glycosyltransferase family 4 protein [Candidatus Bathyarchaeum sp.]